MNNCLLVPLPEGIAEGALAERTGKSAKEFGDVMVRIGEALRDGEISEAEAAGILHEIREVMLELSALAEAVRAATKREDADADQVGLLIVWAALSYGIGWFFAERARRKGRHDA